MKNFPMEGLTELSLNELTTVEGGGLLTNVLTTAAGLLMNLPNTVGSVRNTVNGLLNFLI
ncbi:hypothetical protein [Chitinophaga rupis]|nr:hypothetical protein [Chitinophaga rupis]